MMMMMMCVDCKTEMAAVGHQQLNNRRCEKSNNRYKQLLQVIDRIHLQMSKSIVKYR